MVLILVVVLPTVHQSVFSNITDKAISVGEKSQIKVIQCSINKVAFGVVSKDSSIAEVVSGSSVSNARVAAFSAFQKKNSFGPAVLIIKDSKITSSDREFLIQKKSSCTYNNEKIDTSFFQASELYSSN